MSDGRENEQPPKRRPLLTCSSGLSDVPEAKSHGNEASFAGQVCNSELTEAAAPRDGGWGRTTSVDEGVDDGDDKRLATDSGAGVADGS